MDTNDWRQPPVEKQEIFTFKDIVECQPQHVLYHVIRIGLISFSLQAFQEDPNGQTFYHFYFELNEDFKFKDEENQVVTICALAMWMECNEHNAEELNVHFVVKERPFFSPLVSFDFHLKGTDQSREKNLNLLHIIGALQGKTEELADLLPDERPSNLLRFQFSPLTQVNNEIRGYRDALLQWFIRLHKTVDDVVLNVQDNENTPTLEAQMFSNLIGHKYTTDGSSYDDFLLVTRDEFNRVDHYMAVDMPYELSWAKIWGPIQEPNIDEDDSRESEEDGDQGGEVASDQFGLERCLNIRDLEPNETQE
ncbi:hypothetical protein NW768_009670 [Fusarium equiseti]|uniref:Uncharacterized protein n=1 Tax=Fusarium equiseti TaxID=61235 RepID=A0ABQ8R2S7_FUSEQ|nr:hypothetical protein NW768_009670 [Fusarium equiseti]